MKRIYWLGVGLALLTGCSLIEKPKGHVKQVMLQKTSALPTPNHKYVINLEVTTDVPSDRPYIQLTPHQREPLSGVEWQESLDKILLKAITHNFQDAGLTVYQGTNTISCDYLVKISVRHFGVEYHPGKKKLHVAYFVEMKNQARGPVLRQKLFEVEEDYLWTNDLNYIQALNEAHDVLTHKIYTWINKGA